MKKQILILFAVLFNTAIFAKSSTETVLDKVEQVADSAKQSVKNGVTAVDTSSNFRLIYTDMKEGIAALATSLKVGAEHVYIVIVKQQVVYAITYTILDLFLLSFALFFLISFYRCYRHTLDKKHDWYRHDLHDHFGLVGNLIIGILILILSFIIISHNLTYIVTGFVNPEYGAIQTIIDIVKDAKK